MITIYKVDYYEKDKNNPEGLPLFVKEEFYADKRDAYSECDLGHLGGKKDGSTNLNEVIELSMWEKREATESTRLKIQALAKLTKEEKDALGLSDYINGPKVSQV